MCVCVWGGLSALIIVILTHFVQITLMALGIETKAKHFHLCFPSYFIPFLEVTTEGPLGPWGRGARHLPWGSRGTREQIHAYPLLLLLPYSVVTVVFLSLGLLEVYLLLVNEVPLTRVCCIK